MATVNSLTRDFGPRLRDQMQHCMNNPEEVSKLSEVKANHPEELSKLSEVKAQVDQVKSIMMENIDKAFDRGQPIDGLVTRIEQLHDEVSVCC